MESLMDTINLEVVILVVTIISGVVTLILALFQIVDTYLDIGDKLRKRQLRKSRRDQTQRSDQ